MAPFRVENISPSPVTAAVSGATPSNLKKRDWSGMRLGREILMEARYNAVRFVVPGVTAALTRTFIFADRLR